MNPYNYAINNYDASKLGIFLCFKSIYNIFLLKSYTIYIGMYFEVK